MPDPEMHRQPEPGFLPGKMRISLRLPQPWRLLPTSFSEISPEEAAAQLERTLSWPEADPLVARRPRPGAASG